MPVLTVASRRAITLIELLIACTVFVTIAVALLTVWEMHARALARAQDIMVASSFAENVMESQLARGWAAEDVPETTYDVTHEVEGVPITSVYHCSSTVVDLGGSQLGLKQVNVKVRWQRGDQWKEINVVSMVSWEG